MQVATTDNVAHASTHSTIYYLAAHVCACELPEGAVFLDLRSSAYFAMDAQCLPSLRRMIGNWHQSVALTHSETPGLQDVQLIDALCTRGFINGTASAPAFSSTSIPPTTTCTPNWTLRASLRATVSMLFRVCATYATTTALLRSRHLALLLSQLHRRQGVRPSSGVSHDDLQSIISLFAKLRLWLYTARDNCLLDSIVLTSVLRRYRIDARLHIGVALMPFSAHAWVQLGCCVLDDSVDHVRGYTPILVA